MAEKGVREFVAEFVGTFLLVLTVGCNVLGKTPVWTGVSIACVLMVCIYALGGISGGNFNPAVSFSLGLTNSMGASNGMDWKSVGIYMFVQILAGIVAALTYAILFWNAFNLGPTKGFGFLSAVLCEMLYTFMLCFVVLNVAASKKNGCDTGNQFYGLAIGGVILAGAYGAGAISGGCFNPAVALGLDVSSAGVGFGWGFAYTGYELIGAGIAAGLFRVVRPDDFDESHDGNYNLTTKLVSEFLGTYILVLTVGLNVLAKSPAGAWSIAASLMSMIYALGNVSGAHFNPAVTVAIMLSGRDKCPPSEGGAYIGVQLLGGVAAAYTYAAMHRGATFALEPVAPYGWTAALMGELVFTFVLCFVVLSVAVVKEEKVLSQYFGLAIASCVTAGGNAIGGISGGSLNPAVSTGISAARIIGGGHFYNCLIYSCFELAGAALAAGVFTATHPSEYAKGEKLPIRSAKPVKA